MIIRIKNIISFFFAVVDSIIILLLPKKNLFTIIFALDTCFIYSSFLCLEKDNIPQLTQINYNIKIY